MPRSVNAVASRARRKKVLKLAKGNFGSRGNVWTVAKNTVEKGLTYAYRDRKNKKRQFRSLWIQRINAAARSHGMTYSEFMGKVNAKGIQLNRKVLADLAMNCATELAFLVLARAKAQGLCRTPLLRSGVLVFPVPVISFTVPTSECPIPPV